MCREDVTARSLDGAFHHVVVAVALFSLEARRLRVEARRFAPRSNRIDKTLACALLFVGMVGCHGGDLTPTR